MVLGLLGEATWLAYCMARDGGPSGERGKEGGFRDDLDDGRRSNARAAWCIRSRHVTCRKPRWLRSEEK
eukprot:6536861-Prymnesium_polylepis.2